MTLEEVRRFFAEEIQYFANVKNPALVAAFESVPREKFIGPGPWKIGLTGFVETPDSDPRHVYHNLPISLDESRNLNNGQPGALALWIDALELKPESAFIISAAVSATTTQYLRRLLDGQAQLWSPKWTRIWQHARRGTSRTIRM